MAEAVLKAESYLSRSEILLVILSSIAEDCDFARCETPKRQLINILDENKEHTLIKSKFHIYKPGVQWVSEDVYGAFDILMQSGYINPLICSTSYDILEKVSRSAKILLEQGNILQQDYEFLRDIGKKIKGDKYVKVG